MKKPNKTARPKKTASAPKDKKKVNIKPGIIAFLLDQSGSMENGYDDTCGGFNAYIAELKKAPETKGVTFFLTKFDSANLETNEWPMTQVPELCRENYRPGAATPLWDAIMQGIERAERNVSGKQKCLFIILTDGHENSSTKNRLADVAAKIKEKQGQGWQFVFLGADLDKMESEKLGSMLNINADSTMSYGKGMSGATFAANAGATRGFISGQSIGYDIDPEVKKKVEHRSGRR